MVMEKNIRKIKLEERNEQIICRNLKKMCIMLLSGRMFSR